MIFRGVSEADEKWSEARARASQNVQEVWKDIVGVDDERALNTSLFVFWNGEGWRLCTGCSTRVGCSHIFACIFFTLILCGILLKNKFEYY